MNGIIKILKASEDSNVLIDCVIEIGKHELKKQEGEKQELVPVC